MGFDEAAKATAHIGSAQSLCFDLVGEKHTSIVHDEVHLCLGLRTPESDLGEGKPLSQDTLHGCFKEVSPIGTLFPTSRAP